MIDKLVYEDSKEEHAKKYEVQDKIDELSTKIEGLAKQIQMLESEKRNLQLECDVHDKQIDVVRVKYQDKFDKVNKMRSKLNNKLSENNADKEKWEAEKLVLTDMESEFQAKMDNLAAEFTKLASMERHFGNQ